MAKSQEELLEEQLASLTPEELDEYEKELMGQQNYAPSVEEMAAAKADVQPTTGEALAAGWVNGVPFLKDAVAATEGMADAVEDGDLSFDEAYGNYKENLDETNADLNNVKEQAPWTMAAGEIAGTASTMALGGAALKGAGAGKVLTQHGINVAASAGTGAATMLSQSEDRGISDVMIGGAMGGLAEVGGQYLFSGVKKTGKYLMDKADDANANSIKRILGFTNISSKRQLSKHLSRTGQKESEFLQDILTDKLDDTMTVKFSDAPERMVDKINVRLNQLGDDMGRLYKEVDAAHDVKISIDDLKTSLSDDVAAPFMQSDDPAMQQIGLDLDDYIQSIGKKVKGFKKETTPEGVKLTEDVAFEDTWNLSRVWKLQKDIRKRIESIYKKNGLDLNASKEQQKQVATSLGKHMDEVIESVSSEADDFIGKIKLDRKKYGNLSSVKESVEAELYRAKDDPMSIVKESLGFRSLMISGMATQAVGPVGMVFGPVATRVINSPKTPLYLSEGLKAVANVVKAAPTGEVAARLNAAALMNNDKFKDTMYGTIAEINLMQKPLPREAAQIRLRANDIRNYLKMQQPNTVKDFDTVLEKNNDAELAAFMDNVSKGEGASTLFEEGIGIDGFVYTPEDKQMLELQLKQSDIPASQRIDMIKQLRTTGRVPNMDEVVPYEPKIHIPRTKKIQDY